MYNMKICEDDNYLDGIVYQEDDVEMEIEAYINYDNIQREFGISKYLGDGIACEEWADGSKSWYLNGGLHRTDGPAIEDANGHKRWFINGVEYSEEDFDMVKEVLWAV
jgi:hypothetical protein